MSAGEQSDGERHRIIVQFPDTDRHAHLDMPSDMHPSEVQHLAHELQSIVDGPLGETLRKYGPEPAGDQR